MGKDLNTENLTGKINCQNKTSKFEFTIIVPVYNEEDNIYPLEHKLAEFLMQASIRSCVLFVNDGSSDLSEERIIEVCRRQKDFFYLNITKNSGLSAAIKSGIDNSWSDYIGYIDADLQTIPEDFNLLIPYIKDYQMVMGIRSIREDSVMKKISSRIGNSFRRLFTNDGISDTGCPLKIIKTSYAKRIPFFTGMHRFLPALIQLQGGQVKQIPVKHFPRLAGISKFNLSNRLIAPFIDCFVYLWIKSRHINYIIGENNI